MQISISSCICITNFRVDTSQWSADRKRFINIENGNITTFREPNEEGVYDDVIDTSDTNYKDKYYDLLAQYEILENENESLKKLKSKK